MSENELRGLIQKVSTGATLERAEIQTALSIMMSGVATPAQMGAFLMAMRVRGETVNEITGAAESIALTYDAGRGTARCHRHCWHRRRQPRHVQRLDLQLRSSLPALASRWPSMATDPYPRSPVHRMCFRRSGVKIDLAPDHGCKMHQRCRRRLHVGAFAPCRDETLGAGARPSLAFARSSMCSGRSAIRPASNDRWSASTVSSSWNRLPRFSTISVANMSGSCMATTAWTR